jgi:hypothetical protein
MDKLTILWTSGEKDTIDKMLLLYTLNAKKMGWELR